MPDKSRLGPDFGNSIAFPIRTRRPFGLPSNSQKSFESLAVGMSPRTWPEHFDDLLASTLALPLVLRDTSAVGAPTFAQRADIANGVFRATLAATDEVEVIGVDWGDQRMVPANKGWIFEAGVALPANLATNETLVVGMVSDYNATIDSITLSAWFRVDGGTSPAGLTVKIESDDNTSDRSTTTTFVMTAATFYRFAIDATDIGSLRFLIDDAEIGTLAAAALDGTTLQPAFYLRKASGTTTPTADLDWLHAGWNRQ